MATVLRNARILTADDFRDDLAVVIEDGRIIALLPDAAPQLGDALRISIGSPEENDRVLAALSARRAAA